MILSTCSKAGEDKERYHKKLTDFSARIVFTAHPTQFYPPAILEIIQQLRDHVNDNDLMKVDLALQQLGLTSFSNHQKTNTF